MRRVELHNMLLFGKGHHRFPEEYVLYFIPLDSYLSATPQVHRYTVPSRLFDRFQLEGVYSIALQKRQIIDFATTSTQKIPESIYLKLLQSRDLAAMDSHEIQSRLAKGIPLFNPDLYYTLEDLKRLLSYQAPFGQRFWATFYECILRFFAILLPMVLYSLVMYLYISNIFITGTGIPFARLLTIPFLAIGQLPFAFHLISLLFFVVDLIIMHNRFTRMLYLKRYALRWDGMRKSQHLAQSERRRLILFGSISLATLAISIAVCILFPRFF